MLIKYTPIYTTTQHLFVKTYTNSWIEIAKYALFKTAHLEIASLTIERYVVPDEMGSMVGSNPTHPDFILFFEINEQYACFNIFLTVIEWFLLLAVI